MTRRQQNAPGTSSHQQTHSILTTAPLPQWCAVRRPSSPRLPQLEFPLQQLGHSIDTLFLPVHFQNPAPSVFRGDFEPIPKYLRIRLRIARRLDDLTACGVVDVRINSKLHRPLHLVRIFGLVVVVDEPDARGGDKDRQDDRDPEPLR